MFVQVIQGHVSDAAQVRAQLDQWVEEVAPGAVGWLGSRLQTGEVGVYVVLFVIGVLALCAWHGKRHDEGRRIRCDLQLRLIPIDRVEPLSKRLQAEARE